MNITLTPEIEKVLTELAIKQGTTAELLAIRTLRECFFPETKIKSTEKTVENQPDTKTLADLLSGVGGNSIDSSEFTSDGARMSENTGKRFGRILSDKQQRGKL